jgi:hypothetical protein
MIYKTFEQWKSGNVLEHGISRTEHYSEDQLDLVEMGWNYGYDAGRAVEQALDKKAENAKELGLDYEPAPVQEPVCDKDPQGCWSVRCQLGNKCKNTTPPAAQREPAPGYCKHCKQYTIEEPLPAAQRQWVGLTEEEKQQIFEREDYQGWLDYINAIEAKLKEKNA